MSDHCQGTGGVLLKQAATSRGVKWHQNRSLTHISFIPCRCCSFILGVLKLSWCRMRKLLNFLKPSEILQVLDLIWCPQISNYVRGMRWSLSILWYRSLLMWETKYWFYITFTLMLAWGNFSLTFQSLTSNKCGDVGHVVIWCNIQWVICSDNFYEQGKKNPHQMHVSLSDPSLWFICLLEEPPAFCFDAPFAALEGGMIIVACSHWLTSFQMCAPDGYPENPPQTQISCLALTGWIQAETQIFCCAVLLSSW